MAIDPVCGMQVDEKRAAATARHKDKTYYFCSDGCRKRFEQSPDKYAAQLRQERGDRDA